jgi:hypothetical protein
MSKTPDQLPPLTDIADDDLFIVEDVDAGSTKRIERFDALRGVAIQQVTANFEAASTSTATIPYDDTIPQDDEGTELMQVSFTPRSATSKLRVQAIITAALSTSDDLIAALFMAGENNAIAATAQGGAADKMRNIVLTAEFPANTTTEIVFSVRAGGSAASTLTHNGVSGVRKFSAAVTKSSITVEEYAG